MENKSNDQNVVPAVNRQPGFRAWHNDKENSNSLVKRENTRFHFYRVQFRNVKNTEQEQQRNVIMTKKRQDKKKSKHYTNNKTDSNKDYHQQSWFDKMKGILKKQTPSDYFSQALHRNHPV